MISLTALPTRKAHHGSSSGSDHSLDSFSQLAIFVMGEVHWILDPIFRQTQLLEIWEAHVWGNEASLRQRWLSDLAGKSRDFNEKIIGLTNCGISQQAISIAVNQNWQVHV